MGKLFGKIHILFLTFLITGCAFYITPSIKQDVISNSQIKLPMKILLDMPEEFLHFNYVASYESREIRYFWGESLEERFPEFMQNLFSSVILLDTQKNQVDCDFLAIPYFIDAKSYVRPFVFGVEIGIKIDFISKDKSSSFSIIGHGEGKAHSYSEVSLKEAGESALNGALMELRKQIYTKRYLFNK